ncbi:MAG: type II toxin-antitoxin system VapC family toxin [Chthoniobacterales bacterium]
MRYLLDTHTLLWMRESNPRLNRAKWETVFFSADNEILVSVVSLWEMTIKRSLGKLDFEGSLEDFAADVTIEHGFTLLPVSPTDLDRVATLPHHHHDPFDRLLIAQALEQGATAVTNDRNWKKYRCKVQW